MSTHKKIFVNPFHTKKVFANMKRAGKDFSGRITPLFDTMMVQASKEVGEDSDHPTDSTQEEEVSQDETEHEESVPTPSNDPQPSAKEIVFEEEDPKLEEEMSNTYRCTPTWRDDELMFDTGVLDTDEMHVEAKVIEKDEQSTKLDDSTIGGAVTTVSVEDSDAPTTIEEITLA
ncbi:hypothetical protein Tco_0199322 [Tanacetum coccineum]